MVDAGEATAEIKLAATDVACEAPAERETGNDEAIGESVDAVEESEGSKGETANVEVAVAAVEELEIVEVGSTKPAETKGWTDVSTVDGNTG